MNPAPSDLFCILLTAEEVRTVLNKLWLPAQGRAGRDPLYLRWHISWHGSEATSLACKKKSLIEVSRKESWQDTEMKTVEENEVVYLARNNDTLVAELPFFQNSDHKINLCEEESGVKTDMKKHNQFLNILLGLFLSWEVLWASKNLCMYYLFNRRHWTDMLVLQICFLPFTRRILSAAAAVDDYQGITTLLTLVCD